MARPNFLIIVADDLGYTDTSPYGSEIATPNIQSLAGEGGTIFTDFHTASACSPTRAMLLSGTDNHIAGLGQMLEVMLFHSDLWHGKPGYEGYLNKRVAALPEILKDLGGYRTVMSGKWHLGLTEERFPAKRGFEKSFTLLPGGGNHFNYEPGTAEKPALPLAPPLFARDDKFISHTSLPEDYYSSDYFTTELIRLLDTDTDDQRPFFAYLPFTAPHWPLQAPPDLIQKYKGRYDDGPDVLQAARLEAQRRLGLLSPDMTIAPVSTDRKPWNEMTHEEQMFSARTMEIYAAMVERMDYNIGRIVEYLRQKDQFDNTFILFMSDNGAEGAALEALPLEFLEGMHKHYDNSYENLGTKSSFIWYGPRWAQAATAPSRMSKGYITEGGIRCPAIVHYTPWTNKKVTDEFCTVMDILPTVLELAGVAHPGTMFQGREVVLPRGKSWVSHFVSNGKVHDAEEDFTGWELFGQRAIRRGNYKAVFFPKAHLPEETKWELYDLTQDKGELKDLAEEKPELLKELIGLWVRYESETGVVVAPDPYKLNYHRFMIDAE